MTVDFLRFGIEVEFLLTPRDGKDYKGKTKPFAKWVCSEYTNKKEASWPGMHIDIGDSPSGPNDAIEWSLTDDESVQVTHNKQCGWIPSLPPQSI
jgi:hypothetical protein